MLLFGDQKITPYLWFKDQAEEAIDFYVSIFKNAGIENITRYGEGAPMPAGTVMTGIFYLEGQRFLALNGGPHFSFTPAVSFCIECDSQQEVDYYWNKLGKGGSENPCGWLTDKFGLSWQVVPKVLGELLQDRDVDRAGRVMNAMHQMKKIEIAKLIDAL